MKATRRKLARRLQELASEIRRLNSARLDSEELARLTPREQTRAVKAALTEHHQKASRCC